MTGSQNNYKHKPYVMLKIKRIIKNNYQRCKYGISDEDIYSLDTHLAKIISIGCKQLANNKLGHPHDMEGKNYEEKQEQWVCILNQISHDFNEYSQNSLFDVTDSFKESMKLFQKYFPSLWD